MRSHLAVAALALSACRAGPMPRPMAPDRGVIAIHVKIRAPVRIVSQKAEQVLFVRLSGPGGSATAGEMLPSNHEENGYCFLMNAPPGTYVAVTGFRDMEPVPTPSAASPGFSVEFHPGPANYTTYFPAEMIARTEVTLSPGDVAFMGDFVVDQNLGLKDADPTQRHFYALFGGGDEEEGFLANAFGGDYHYRGELHRGETGAEAQADFREAVSARLIEAGWSLAPER